MVTEVRLGNCVEARNVENVGGSFRELVRIMIIVLREEENLDFDLNIKAFERFLS